ncbi:MAG TPA: DUF4837 family protein [Cyclobacteriaceae bacterium]|nr:DUF4837 family protein [Cyclobacteriaceae bacterium]
MRALFLLFSTIVFAACSSGDRSANLPKAAGASGDIYLFMDSAQWKGQLGKVMDSIFNQEMIGLPREEGIFRMTQVDPRALNFVLKQRRNLIFLVTLDRQSEGSQVLKNLLTEEQVAQINSDSSKYISTYQNVYAKDQQVMFLFAQNEDQMLKKLRKNSKRLIDFFDKVENDRLNTTLFQSGTVTGVTKWMKENFNAEMTIPFGYKLVQNEPDYLWVRQINTQDDRSIFIARTDYTSVDQFKKENLIKFRDQVAQKYLLEDPDKPNSAYVMTETTIPYIPVVTKEVNFNGNYAVEMRGLWATSNKSMGGPFLAYALTDKETGKFYYIEGFVFGPSKELREMMRQIEVILHTFKLQSPPAEPAAGQ